jgi:hypothetical protein
LFGPLYDPVKMKLNLPTELTKTLTSATTPTTPTPDLSNLFAAFPNALLINRFRFHSSPYGQKNGADDHETLANKILPFPW